MVSINYCPERGDVVWLDFNPQACHEQKGRQPAIVISPSQYNNKVGLALICPITSQVKNYPFEVKLPDKFVVSGVIISDQIKSLDWRMRNIEFIDKVSHDIIEETLNKFSSLIRL